MDPLSAFLKIYDYIRPVLDVGLLTFLLFEAYQIITKTNAMQLIKAAIIVGIAYGFVALLDLKTLKWIFDLIAPGIIMAAAIVFQPELRKIFLKLGQTQWFTAGKHTKHTYVDQVVIAAQMLSQQRRGMLVVFLRQTKMEDIMKTGTFINADLTSNLLVTIFGHDTPLHDGACFVKGGKLISAGCFLPLSQQYDIRKTFGTRHRAALGLSEVSDAVILVVSEETGAFSLAYDSKLHYDLSIEQVTNILENELDITPEAKKIEDTIDEHKAIS